MTRSGRVKELDASSRSILGPSPPCCGCAVATPLSNWGGNKHIQRGITDIARYKFGAQRLLFCSNYAVCATAQHKLRSTQVPHRHLVSRISSRCSTALTHCIPACEYSRWPLLQSSGALLAGLCGFDKKTTRYYST